MKRLIIVVEGETEKEFVDKVLSPYLYSKGFTSTVNCFKIKHSNGGLTKYQHLKTDLINCSHETNVLISTFIDFYALPKDFPKYQEASKIFNKNERLTFLEKAIVEDLEKEQINPSNQLIPYIQLHEFEALVFASLDAIQNLYTEDEADFKAIQNIIQSYPNPENINNSPETSPSKRIKNQKLIKGYKKPVHGIMIVQEAGIDLVLQKCPRLNTWVQKLIHELIP